MKKGLLIVYSITDDRSLFQEKEKTSSGYKHNNKVSHGIFTMRNLIVMFVTAVCFLFLLKLKRHHIQCVTGNVLFMIIKLDVASGAVSPF